MNMELISLLLNLLLGGGLIVTVATLKGQKKQVEATAEGSELDNVSKAIAIWQQSAEASEKRAQAAEERAQAAEERSQNTADKYAGLADEVSQLRGEVKKLTTTNNRIIKILDSINHDNLEQKKQEAKDITGA
jgi:methyl-accepting chemotaxis protein